MKMTTEEAFVKNASDARYPPRFWDHWFCHDAYF